MPDLVRLYLRSIAAGFGIAALFTAALVWWDVAGVGHLILGSDIGWLAALMLVMFNGIVFAAVQFALAIAGLGLDDRPGGHGARAPVLVPIPVRASRRR